MCSMRRYHGSWSVDPEATCSCVQRIGLCLRLGSGFDAAYPPTSLSVLDESDRHDPSPVRERAPQHNTPAPRKHVKRLSSTRQGQVTLMCAPGPVTAAREKRGEGGRSLFLGELRLMLEDASGYHAAGGIAKRSAAMLIGASMPAHPARAWQPSWINRAPSRMSGRTHAKAR